MAYNNKTETMENVEGVDIRVRGFGNTDGIEWLDPNVHGPGVYFYPLVDALVRFLSYKRGVNLVSAPFDFRRDPNTAGDYFDRLKKLIENTAEKNGKSIVLLSHSMGCPYTVNFLRLQTQDWKDKYIKSWISISGVYGGSVKAVLAYTSGCGFGIPAVLDKPQYLREFQRTFSSLAFIVPDKDFWAKDEAIVRITDKKISYTPHDYDQLFDDIGYPTAKQIIKKVPKQWYPEPPNVRMYCIHGSKLPTAKVLNYHSATFPDGTPDITFGDGDGTVNYRSLLLCTEWANKQKQLFNHTVFPEAEHNGILGDPRLLNLIQHILKDNPAEEHL